MAKLWPASLLMDGADCLFEDPSRIVFIVARTPLIRHEYSKGFSEEFMKTKLQEISNAITSEEFVLNSGNIIAMEIYGI